MRDALLEWVSTYPKDIQTTTVPFGKGSRPFHLVRDLLPEMLRATLIERGIDPSRYILKGSPGPDSWTQVPWLAAIDQGVTTTVQEGYYAVYLLSHGCDRLYLILGQGCTRLHDEAGNNKEAGKSKKAFAAETLIRRAEAMRNKLGDKPKRLRMLKVMLGAPTNNWRAYLYEASAIVGVEYDTASLPSDADLIADLAEALNLYRILAKSGGDSAADTVLAEAEADGIEGKAPYQKAYVQHRRAERIKSHSDKVKRMHPLICRGCGRGTDDFYNLARVEGGEGLDILEAHHLIPLSTLAEGGHVTFDIMRDFALLCPNCHRMIHRIGAADIQALRDLVRK